MAYPADFPRTIVIRARRDTAALVIGATVATFVLANVVHTHRSAATLPRLLQSDAPPEQSWAGELSDASEPPTAPDITFTSASLVLPRSELALPHMSVRALVRIRGCEASACVAKSNAQTPPRRSAPLADGNDGLGKVAGAYSAPVVTVAKSDAPRARPTLMSKINPLNHLPDVSTIKRPFVSAGETVSNWLDRL